MAKLAQFFIIIPFLPIITGRIGYNYDVTYNDLDLVLPLPKFRTEQGSAWVVDFKNGLDRVVLRQATGDECEMLKRRVGVNLGQKKSSVVKKVDPAKSYDVTEEENKSIEKDLMKVINKFLYAIRDDPDTNLSESGDDGDSYLSVYFVDDTTCVTVTTGRRRRQWHYVIRNPVLPAWFYEDHKTEGPNLEIPEQEKHALFKGLLSLIANLNSHPV